MAPWLRGNKQLHLCSFLVYYIFVQTLSQLWLVDILYLWLKIIAFMIIITFMMSTTFKKWKTRTVFLLTFNINLLATAFYHELATLLTIIL